MKRTILFIMFVWASLLPILAQKGLEVDKVFSRYGHAHGCKMVEMHDATLRGYKLVVYKSLTYKNIGNPVTELLKTDRRHAKKIREIVENGKVTGGYYMMPQVTEGINRYILFNNAEQSRGAVIYIEGKLSPDDIIKICYTR